MSDRKESYKKASKKRASTLKDMGMVSLNTHVKADVKDKLTAIQKKNGYRLIGDAIEDVLNNDKN
jgi:hypothetical protein